MYVVILAGGGGTRLWPLSTPDRPKPFLPLLEPRSLLRLTVDRLAGLVGPEDVHLVTDGRYAPLVRAQLPEVPAANLLAEPTGRNTAAAIALAALSIDRPDDESMLVLPADHHIPRESWGLFRDVLKGAAGGLVGEFPGASDPLVTLGIQTGRAATEYGYLRPDIDSLHNVRGLDGYRLKAFIEKPGHDDANDLFHEVGVAWNAGIFVWRRRAILRALRRHASDILDGVQAALENRPIGLTAYAAVRATSVDYAVMEAAAAAGEVVMGSMNVPWSDLGSWPALLAALGAPGGPGSRVVPAGEAVHLGPDDLLIARDLDRLSVLGGPASMGATEGPRALLAEARADRAVVEALLARAMAAETEERPA